MAKTNDRELRNSEKSGGLAIASLLHFTERTDSLLENHGTILGREVPWLSVGCLWRRWQHSHFMTYDTVLERH